MEVEEYDALTRRNLDENVKDVVDLERLFG